MHVQEYRRTLLSRHDNVPHHERLKLRSLRRKLIAAEAPQEGGFIEVLGPSGNASVPIAGEHTSGSRTCPSWNMVVASVYWLLQCSGPRMSSYNGSF